MMDCGKAESNTTGMTPAQVEVLPNAKRWLTAALFPVSAGAVTTEIVGLAATSLDMEHRISIWAGFIAAALAILFQIYRSKVVTDAGSSADELV